MRTWATADTIRAEIAEVPTAWLVNFALRHPDAIRKFGDARNATRLYHTGAVLRAIAAREGARK